MSKRDIKHSSDKVFEGSRDASFYNAAYFKEGVNSNYGCGGFIPYDERYLDRDRATVTILKKVIPELKSAIILGCARGYLIQAFREQGIDAVGVDISEWAVENCAEGMEDHIYCGDVCDLSKWGDGEFTLAVAFDIFEHIAVPDLYKAIGEACRVAEWVVINLPINPDDETPDMSAGQDKSHVSVYSKTWWIQQFMGAGHEPVDVQEWGYPTPSPGSRWEDKKDHNVTIYFRKAEKNIAIKLIPTPTIRSGGKDFKILWWSNGPWCGTGYGIGTKHVVYPLNEHYDVAALAYWGLEGAALTFNGLKVFPKMYDQFGIDAADLICRNWNPDIMITLFDIWIGDSPLFNGERNWFTKIHPRHVAYFPIDHYPIPIPILNQAEKAYHCIAMSKFGLSELRKNNIDASYIPHGCLVYDTEIITENGIKKLGEVITDKTIKYVLGYDHGKLKFTKILGRQKVPVLDGKLSHIKIGKRELIGTLDHPIMTDLTEESYTPLGDISQDLYVSCVYTHVSTHGVGLCSGYDGRGWNNFSPKMQQGFKREKDNCIGSLLNDNQYKRRTCSRDGQEDRVLSNNITQGCVFKELCFEGVSEESKCYRTTEEDASLSRDKKGTSEDCDRVHRESKQRQCKSWWGERSVHELSTIIGRESTIFEQKVSRVQIENMGKKNEWVYDITTETNNFIANGIIVHNCDTKVFTPIEDTTVPRKWLIDVAGIPLFSGSEVEKWDNDSFIIGKVAANKDTARKGFDREMAAFRVFLDQNPDAKKDARIYWHTDPRFPGGFNLDHYAHLMGVDKYIKKTHPFYLYGEISEPNMAKMYQSFDLFTNVSRNEGFGIPIIESQSCGIPNVVNDSTSMPELVSGHGWVCKPKTWEPTALLSNQFIPDEYDIAKAYGEAYNNPDKVRSLGVASRDFAEQYDWDNVITPLWLQLIERLREGIREKTYEERRVTF